VSGAFADHDLAAGQVERQEGREVLLQRQPADGEKHRTQQAEARVAARAKQARVDPARPAQHAPKTARRQLVGQRRGRRKRAAAGIVEPAQQGPAELLRDAPSRRHVVGEAGMEAGGERPAASDAIPAHCKADRPFGRDMDGVGRDRGDAGHDLPRIGQRDADVGKSRQRHRRHAVRREEVHLGAEGTQAVGE